MIYDYAAHGVFADRGLTRFLPINSRSVDHDGLVVRWCNAQSPATANDNSIASAGGSMHVARVSSVVHQLVCVAVIIVQGTALLIITDDSATHLMHYSDCTR